MNKQLILGELLRKSYPDMSPAEKRIARVILADYPVAGLEPVKRLADRSNVSAPTVLRLLSKLGIGSYPDMQRLLHWEISARTSSPAEMFSKGAAVVGGADGSRIIETIERGIETTFKDLSPEDLDSVAQLLATSKKQIWIAGGRFSRLLAEYLAMHLKHLRRHVTYVDVSQQSRAFALLDITTRDVVIVFDYRRYQDSTINFLEQAKAQKATTILVTDPWMSPASKFADHLMTSAVESPSPFDLITPGFALIEALIAKVVQQLDETAHPRVTRYDAIDRQLNKQLIDKDDAVGI